MTAILYLARKAHLRKVRARKLIAFVTLLKLRMYLRDRHFLRASSLFLSVKEAPWYIMYRNGSDSELISVISLTRNSFEYLLSKFKMFFKFKSGPNKKGRPPRIKDHHCVLSLLLHSYCSPAEKKTWSEMFGITPSTLSRTIIKAENALLLALNSMKEADITWPSKEDQVRMAILVEQKVFNTNPHKSIYIIDNFKHRVVINEHFRSLW